MKRIAIAGLAALAMLVIGAGTASADPGMTYDIGPAGCDMTYDCHTMTHD
ncbi:hypothetical protein [Flindersiella endophytica]